MAWIRLEDRFHRHPKIVHVGRDARDLWVAAMCWSAAAGQDGFVPTGALRQIAADAGVTAPVPKLIGRLLTYPEPYEVGLFEQAPGGYVVHDYLDFNLSAAEIESRKAARKAAGKLGGERSGSTRRSKREANDEAGASENGEANVKQKGTPVPHVPSPHEHFSNTDLVHQEETARATETPIERVRTLAIPKPGLTPGSPQVALSRALAAALNCAEPTTKSERGKWAAAITEMLHAAPPVAQAEVGRLVEVYRDRNSVPCTPQGIVNQLEQLRGDQVAPRPSANGAPPSKLAQNAAIFRSLTAPGAGQ